MKRVLAEEEDPLFIQNYNNQFNTSNNTKGKTNKMSRALAGLSEDSSSSDDNDDNNFSDDESQRSRKKNSKKRKTTNNSTTTSINNFTNSNRILMWSFPSDVPSDLDIDFEKYNLSTMGTIPSREVQLSIEVCFPTSINQHLRNSWTPTTRCVFKNYHCVHYTSCNYRQN